MGRKHHQIRRVVGHNIRRLRYAKGLSQEDLCAEVDNQITRSALSRIENGQRDSKLRTLAAFAKALDVEPAILFLDPTNPTHNLAFTILKHKNKE